MACIGVKIIDLNISYSLTLKSKLIDKVLNMIHEEPNDSKILPRFSLYVGLVWTQVLRFSFFFKSGFC